MRKRAKEREFVVEFVYGENKEDQKEKEKYQAWSKKKT